MEDITLDFSNVSDFIEHEEIVDFQKRVNKCHDMIHNKTGPGGEYLGWVDLASNYNITEFEKIKVVAEKIRSESDIFIVIGIGGSYLGSRAAIEMLNETFYNEISRDEETGPKIYFAGHNISSNYLNNLINIIGDKEVSINIISKSGTTTEPAIMFRLLREYMEEKYGIEEASKRIYATTDKNEGALKELSDKKGYETFIIPDDIGGRYSVMTPVGLLPMAVSGINIDDVMDGLHEAEVNLMNDSIESNDAYKYAVIRNILYSKGKTIEILESYEPNLFYFGEWFKQLFGESEGKEDKGIFPTTLNFTTDLHSMGQYIQEGRRNIFETTLNIEKSMNDVKIKKDDDNLDELNYLEGKSLNYINNKAMKAAIKAHVEGGVPNIIINIPEISPYYFGYLVYFLEKACAMSGYLLGVNPFNQPGVELYKENMFRLLEKPGYNKISKKK